MRELSAGAVQAWRTHFRALARQYADDAALAISLARRVKGEKRRAWVRSARALNRAARKCWVQSGGYDEAAHVIDAALNTGGPRG